MVKKFLKFLVYSLFFLAALAYFTPKENMYYEVEKKLAKYDISMSDKGSIDNGISLTIENVKVYLKSKKNIQIEYANVKVFLLYNSIDLKNIVLLSNKFIKIPLRIEQMKISYTILNPFSVHGTAVGEFGTAVMNFSIFDKRLKIYIKPSRKLLQNHWHILRYLVKTQDGGFIYEQSF